MKKLTLLGITAGVLSLGILTGCGSIEKAKVAGSKADQAQVDKNVKEEEADKQEGLGQIGEFGKVTVLGEAAPFVLEGNENIGYELSDVKLVKIEDYTEDGEWGILWGTGFDSADQLPDSVYAVIGTEKKTNKTDMSIEFSGIKTLALGSEQIDVLSKDIATEDEDISAMLGGVELETQFAVIVKDPDATSLKLLLSSAFDSETFSNDLLKEQEINLTLTSK
ncbi:hypothetical protein SporoP37_02405 [Sporosarcina sp. P37]|uniref:hypothetical protein n=1 Tax=unclassified Sporosarcina TaxID=2647733 RepID=UPI0009C11E95|nr:MULTISPECIES: hypothetical protein [unclassified Sporosarcina]ARD47107.1 hypothetical protein SporoP33_01845 [Sporosarcina sp. P33]ARK23653.1 hypothetical protein SporoP37_02405 [Sporosarcina sp. P37]PID18722.1 hypothetical protein CSV62_06345 [Sporosarcina sp. P35]